MHSLIFIVIIVVLIALRFGFLKSKHKRRSNKPTQSNVKQAIQPGKQTYKHAWQRQLRTVIVFTKLGTKRFFRDRLAQFFAVLFPLIFLFVFGSLSKGGGNVSFHVAVINQSNTAFSKNFAQEIESSNTFKVDKSADTLSLAESQMAKSQVDGIIVLPSNFGEIQHGQSYPSGQAEVLYDETSADTGQTLTSVLQGVVKQINNKFVKINQPFSVTGQELNQHSLTSFDYTFSGLLGFSIIGIGVFGPVNVFPELKKQGILRRLHTTPLRVWQYFMATMLGQAITIQFIVAIGVFHLKVDGNYLYIFIYAVLSIFMILGLGLAIGGWAKNERQAAPLSNIVVFPMLFLSGTFFPRYLMPDWLQSVTNYLPLTPVIDGLRLLTTEGKSLFQIGPQIGLVAIWFVIVYAIAFRVFKWE
jgi:ABC-2 type transport system permease protein